ncbi:hypothetical protein LY78DRAFT_232172 [Colletotrichum sublineola]|nr:hypothetical protein LY78DRAFT_232172 [Colletotrichum sublineola]
MASEQPTVAPLVPSSDPIARMAARLFLDPEDIDEKEDEFDRQLKALRKKTKRNETARLKVLAAEQLCHQSHPGDLCLVQARAFLSLRYNGQDQSELETFLLRLKDRFQIFDVREDSQRVFHTSRCFTGSFHRQWLTYVFAHGGLRAITWQMMEAWLKANVSAGEDIRAFEAPKMPSMRQQSNQIDQQSID